jgi:hypothetical protein
VVCWGIDFIDGYIGAGLTPPPDSVNGIAGTASAISLGGVEYAGNSCAIQAGSGSVVCWGDPYGQMQPPPSVDGTTGSASVIATGRSHACAIQAGTGAIVCWGSNSFGEATPPPSVNGTSGSASAIATGDYHSCAIRAGSGSVVCWGRNDLGQGTPPPSVNGTAGGATAIAAGGFHTLAIALPEPEQVESMLAGCALLVALARRRGARMRIRPESAPSSDLQRAKEAREMISRDSIGIAAAGALCLALLTTAAGAVVPDPVVSGPIPSTATPGDPSHDYIFFASPLDLASQGYVEEEYFLSGTANRYLIFGTSTATILDASHPYETRIVVRRPASAAQFNGVVIVEWLNVTNGLDMENTWFQIDEHLLRSGYAWVGVSAQRVGVNRLRTWNPSRYGTLDVSQRNASGVETLTNDELSYDAFSQAAQAVRSPAGIDPFGGLEPELVIATGHSQSAMFLARYVNAIQPLSHAFDAFALHGSLGNAIRVDLEVPVWKVLSEYDVSGFNEAQVRRPDDGFFRTWEVAGTSHNDRKSYASRVPLQLRDIGVAVEAALACGVMPPGSAAPFHHVMAAGLDHLVRWVSDGTPMPSAPPLATVSIFPPLLARDSFGNALGGIRLSQMEVPTAVHNGTNTGPGACPRWGYSVDFDAQTLATLYPTHAGYVTQVRSALDQNLSDGFLLPPDAQQTLLIALPELEHITSLLAGCAFLVALARRRCATVRGVTRA